METSKKTISIIDDHTLFRKGLIALINLFEDYFVISEASNGKEYLDQISTTKPADIILIDINMPIMDGYETTENLLKIYPEAQVLALSTMDSDIAVIKMIRSGAKGYILKDADPTELKCAFDEVMQNGYFYNNQVTNKVMKSVNSIVQNSFDSFFKLTDREKEFLKWCCSELSYKQIANEMFLSPRTVEGYSIQLCEKLNLKTRIGLAMYAIKNNLVKL